jgi:hypothetical protein
MALPTEARQELENFLAKWSPEIGELLEEIKSLVSPLAWENAIQNDCQLYNDRLNYEAKRELLLQWAEELGYKVH